MLLGSSCLEIYLNYTMQLLELLLISYQESLMDDVHNCYALLNDIMCDGL
jgi:hypothetical protein